MRRRLFRFISKSVFLLLPLLAIFAGGCWASSLTRADDWFIIACRPGSADPANRVWSATGVRCMDGRLVLMRYTSQSILLRHAVQGWRLSHQVRLLTEKTEPTPIEGEPVFATRGIGYFRKQELKPVTMAEEGGRPPPILNRSYGLIACGLDPRERAPTEWTKVRTSDSVHLPFWLIILTLLCPWMLMIVRHRRRSQRLGRGCCPACGYDMRASAGRCPECGTSKSADRDVQPNWRGWLYPAAIVVVACLAVLVRLRSQPDGSCRAPESFDERPLAPALQNFQATLVEPDRIRFHWNPQPGDTGQYWVSTLIADDPGARPDYSWIDPVRRELHVGDASGLVTFRAWQLEDRSSPDSDAVRLVVPMKPPSPIVTALSPTVAEVFLPSERTAYDGLEIERSEGEGTFTPLVAILDGSAEVRYRDRTVKEGAMYAYRARRVNGSDRSPFSEPVKVFMAPLSAGDVLVPLTEHSRANLFAPTQPFDATTQPFPAEYSRPHILGGAYDPCIASPTEGLRPILPIPLAFLIAAGGGSLILRFRGRAVASRLVERVRAVATISALVMFVAVSLPQTPNAPSHFTGVTDAGEVVLRWSPPNNGWPRFRIESASQSDVRWKTETTTEPGATTVHLYEPISEPQRYRLVALGPNGESAPSAPVTLDIPLEPPDRLTVHTVADAVGIVSERGIIAPGTRIERWNGSGYTPVKYSRDDPVAMDDEPVPCGNRFIYRIRNERSGRPPSPWVWAMGSTDPLQVAPPPVSAQAEARVGSEGKPEVVISWVGVYGTEPLDVSRVDDSEEHAPTFTVPGSSRQYVDNSVKPGHTYQYFVRLSNRSGPSPASPTSRVYVSQPNASPASDGKNVAEFRLPVTQPGG